MTLLNLVHERVTAIGPRGGDAGRLMPRDGAEAGRGAPWTAANGQLRGAIRTRSPSSDPNPSRALRLAPLGPPSAASVSEDPEPAPTVGPSLNPNPSLNPIRA
ncbi:MAG: hypothetical protein HS111_30950 [Kofleriaceae bacterium]|nr:hypothetical protein [Kofleriaceae bacterium]